MEIINGQPMGGVCRVLGPGLIFSIAWDSYKCLPAPLAGGMYLNQRVAFLALPLPIAYWYIGQQKDGRPCPPREDGLFRRIQAAGSGIVLK